MVTDIEVILNATLLPVPKYNGTKANHMTQVVYIVKPKGKIPNLIRSNSLHEIAIRYSLYGLNDYTCVRSRS